MPPKSEAVLIINKIPLDKPYEIKESCLERTNTLYLELLENKKKVIPALKDKDFVPKVKSSPKKEYTPLKSTSTFKSPPKKSATKKTPEGPKIVFNEPKKEPPTLSEIRKSAPVYTTEGLRQIDYVTNSEEMEAIRKKELLWEFNLLKEINKDADIPNYTEYSNLASMESDYKRISKSLKLKNTVKNWKQYLQYLFLATEVGLKKFAGIEEMDGYASYQSSNIEIYNEVLYKAAEKYSLVNIAEWNPIVLLVGLIILQTVVFIIGKFAAKSFFTHEILSNIKPKETKPAASAKKMKGPMKKMD